MKDVESNARTNGAKAMARARRNAIEFLLNFSQADAEKLLADDRPGDLLNICSDLSHLGVGHLYTGLVSRGSKSQDLIAGVFRAHPERLRTLIRKLRELVDVVADGGKWTLNFVPGAQLVVNAGYHWEREAHVLKVTRKLPATSPHYTHERQLPRIQLRCPADDESSHQPLLCLAAILLSQSDESTMVRRCSRSNCRRIFLATRPKQIFCSRQCASAAVFERYKEKLGDEYAQRRKTAREEAKKKRSADRGPSPVKS